MPFANFLDLTNSLRGLAKSEVVDIMKVQVADLEQGVETLKHKRVDLEEQIQSLSEVVREKLEFKLSIDDFNQCMEMLREDLDNKLCEHDLHFEKLFF